MVAIPPPYTDNNTRFYDAAIRIHTTRKPVDDAGDVGAYQGNLDELNHYAEQELPDRIDDMLSALAERDKQFAARLAEQEQEQQDARLTTDEQGKVIFKTLSLDDVLHLPDPEYMLGKHLQQVAVSLWYGPSSIGKTGLALDQSLCIAHGIPWKGRKVKQGAVLYIYAEGATGIKRRVLAWHQEHNLQFTPNIRFIAVPVHLLDDKQTLINTIASQAQMPALLVVDPFSMCALGTDQNKTADVTQVLMTGHIISQQFQMHVLVTHHDNKMGNFNGAQSFKNHVDAMFSLTQQDEFAPIVVHCEKMRDDSKPDDVKLTLQQVHLGTDENTREPITSFVLVESSAQSRTEQDQQAAAEQVQKDREIMHSILQKHRRMNVRDWIAACKQQGISRRTFYELRPCLEQEKRISCTPGGKGKPAYYEVFTPFTPFTESTVYSENRSG